MRFISNSLTALLLLMATSLYAQQINPNTQIRWPAATGSGAPTAACSTANYGQPYTDVANNIQYQCGASGWFQPPPVGGPFLPLSGGTLTSPGNVVTPGTVTADGSISATSYVSHMATLPTSAIHYGDSITYCYGTSAVGPIPTKEGLVNCYWNLLDAYLGVGAQDVYNRAEAGAQAADESNLHLFPVDPGPGTTANPPIVTWQIGTNDVTYGGTGYDAAYIPTFSTIFLADIAWDAMTTAEKALASTATTTGTCTTDNTYAANPGIACTTVGSTITFSFTTPSAGAVYAFVRYIDGDTGVWNYSLDGGATTSQTTSLTPNIHANLGSNQAVGLIRIPNVSAGTHTLTFTETTAGTMSVIAVAWPPPGELQWKPVVEVGDMPNNLNGANQTIINQYRAQLDADVNLLASDGLNEILVPVSKYVQATTAAGDMYGTVHPNTIGEKEMYAAFASALGPLPQQSGMATWDNPYCLLMNGSSTYQATPGISCYVANGPATLNLPVINPSPEPNFSYEYGSPKFTVISLSSTSPVTLTGWSVLYNLSSTIAGNAETMVTTASGRWASASPYLSTAGLYQQNQNAAGWQALQIDATASSSNYVRIGDTGSYPAWLYYANTAANTWNATLSGFDSSGNWHFGYCGSQSSLTASPTGCEYTFVVTNNSTNYTNGYVYDLAIPTIAGSGVSVTLPPCTAACNIVADNLANTFSALNTFANGIKVGAAGSTISSIVTESQALTFPSITAPGCAEVAMTGTTAFVSGASGGICHASPAGTMGANFYYGGCFVNALSPPQPVIKVCAAVTGTPTAQTWNAVGMH